MGGSDGGIGPMIWRQRAAQIASVWCETSRKSFPAPQL